MVAKYQKRPVVIEAIQLSTQNWAAVQEFVTAPGLERVNLDQNNRPTKEITGRSGAIIPTLEGEMIAVDGDYIIKGVKGEFYPCKPDIFEQTHRPAVELQNNVALTGERMFKWFAYGHLPPHLQATSEAFYDLAAEVCQSIQAGPERTVALRKLLESKDAAVRAKLNPGG